MDSFPLYLYRLINYGKVTVTVQAHGIDNKTGKLAEKRVYYSSCKLWYSLVNYVGQYNNRVEKCNIIQIVRCETMMLSHNETRHTIINSTAHKTAVFTMIVK